MQLVYEGHILAVLSVRKVQNKKRTNAKLKRQLHKQNLIGPLRIFVFLPSNTSGRYKNAKVPTCLKRSQGTIVTQWTEFVEEKLQT